MSRNQNRKGGSKRGRPDEWHADARDPSTLYNEAFEKFYKGNIIAEEEWSAFMECLRTSLPMALRFNIASERREEINAFVSSRLGEVFETIRLPFFPNNGAVQAGVSRGDLKRNRDFKTLKKIISALNEGGYLTRQETVSMLPPVLLQVKPNMKVLDMCAAPGSKTSQILEHFLVSSSDTGVVVANDVNASRLDVLHHQTNRAAGAHPHLIITNYDATRFPVVESSHKFDRVLCDVMCSGDGTLRKSIDMWPRWSPLQGANLHSAQIRVLQRGMQLCKKDGVVVYSTCSLNPVEDEAVVSACLTYAKGAFELVDPAPLLPGLKGDPGRTTWSLTTRDGEATLRTYDEATAYMERHEEKRQFRYVPSMFAAEGILADQHINRTRRILPHSQDTGGFFVAALRCVEELETTPSTQAEKGDCPLRPVTAGLRATIQKALQLPDDFPYHRLLVRNEEAREQKIYLANEATQEVSHQLGSRVVHVGSKVFESYAKYSNDRLRFTHDGVADLAPFLPESFKIRVDPAVVLQLVKEQPMSFHDFAERTGRKSEDLPPSFLLQFEWPTVGPVYVVAEKSAKLGKVVARVAEWQATFCKLALGIPLVDEVGGEKGEEVEMTAVDPGNE